MNLRIEMTAVVAGVRRTTIADLMDVNAMPAGRQPGQIGKDMRIVPGFVKVNGSLHVGTLGRPQDRDGVARRSAIRSRNSLGAKGSGCHQETRKS